MTTKENSIDIRWWVLSVILLATILALVFDDRFMPPLVASGIILGAQFLIDKITSRRRFGKFEGDYDSYTLDGAPLPGKFKLRYMTGNVLKVYVTGTRYGDWEGQIIMNKDVPYVGEGVHEYKDEPWCGHLRFQYREAEDSFYILATDKALGQEDSSAYVIKRRSQRTGQKAIEEGLSEPIHESVIVDAPEKATQKSR